MFALAVLFLATRIAADGSVPGFELAFSPDTLGTCTSRFNDSSSDSLPGGTVGFTAFGLTQNHTCFNLNEFFAANATNTNTWSVQSAANFDPAANYSRVWYRQTDLLNGDRLVGKTAPMYTQLYPLQNCQEASDSTQRPAYGTSCGSGVYGDCYTAAYSVASFAVDVREFEDKGKCWNFHAEKNAALHIASRSWNFWLMLFAAVGCAFV